MVARRAATKEDSDARRCGRRRLGPNPPCDGGGSLGLAHSGEEANPASLSDACLYATLGDDGCTLDGFGSPAYPTRCP
uniref:Uncharacterized protein n=1 Tax=Arundo donax TaxID=35708 RepID=A0A0A8YY32_ARUDO